MYFYVAQFLPAEEREGAYAVTFPDLPGCITQGESLEDAFRMAQEALECHLLGMHEDNDPLPVPSSLKEARAKAETEAAEDGEVIPEGTLYQLVPAPSLDIPPVRVNISLAPHVLALVDRVAQEEGMSRSGFLVAAARHYAMQLRA
ncbi:type II toxin-antitoxin system HicB family antitoxin [Nitratidesulfovibrio sp. D1]|uniref:type II toxin-antitoxin system HicB family antitoxin n=1 Tax=Nitratidesulfovibrio sp. D1 TaxID=3440151 RepID=UPI003EB880E8